MVLMKRRLLLIFLLPVLAFCFGSCSFAPSGDLKELDSWARGTDKLKVLSTTAMIGDLASEIGGDRVSHNQWRG